MSAEKTLVFYLEAAFRQRAEAGKVNFVNRITSAFASRGFAVAFRGNSDAEVLASALHPGYAFYLMERPISPRGLTIRLSYFYPFWRIEKSAKRWDWEVARAAYDPDTLDRAEAERFAGQWRKRLFGTDAVTRSLDGHVYIPLQGRLTEHRSFQSMSPLDMIRTTLALEPNRRIVAGLHPNEAYSVEELTALDRLVQSSSRLSLSGADAVDLVSGAAYVVTQNSSVAMTGYFLHRPAVLFGRIDFHHIAASIHRVGVEEAFRQVQRTVPDFDVYLFWFLQKMAINAGRQDAEQRILETVRARGWQV